VKPRRYTNTVIWSSRSIGDSICGSAKIPHLLQTKRMNCPRRIRDSGAESRNLSHIFTQDWARAIVNVLDRVVTCSPGFKLILLFFMRINSIWLREEKFDIQLSVSVP
jgi:hypothetical protein